MSCRTLLSWDSHFFINNLNNLMLILILNMRRASTNVACWLLWVDGSQSETLSFCLIVEPFTRISEWRSAALVIEGFILILQEKKISVCLRIESVGGAEELLYCFYNSSTSWPTFHHGNCTLPIQTIIRLWNLAQVLVLTCLRRKASMNKVKLWNRTIKKQKKKLNKIQFAALWN